MASQMYRTSKISIQGQPTTAPRQAAQIRGSTTVTQVNVAKQKVLKLLKMFIAMFSCYLLYVVFTISELIFAITNTNYTNYLTNYILGYIRSSLLVLTSIINPIITIINKEDYRQLSVSLFSNITTCLLRRQTRQGQENIALPEILPYHTQVSIVQFIT